MAEFNIEAIPSQKGRIAIVTGANTGLGFETAKVLAGKGMKVIMACRNQEKAQAAKQSILKEHPAADPEIMIVDLSRLKSVRDFAQAFLSAYNRLDLLINNAGIMIPPYSKTKDGFESQMGINYFSHFLLTGLLFNTIARTVNSRIVTLSSNAHKNGNINFEDLQWEKGYSRMKAYSQSKLACLMFAYELQRKIERAGLKTLSVAAHPGVSLTELVRYIPGWLLFLGRPVTALMTHSPEKAALPILLAALDKDVKGGEYFGPQGRNEWKGKPGKAESTPLSHNTEIAGKLWKVSEELTGIKFL